MPPRHSTRVIAAGLAAVTFTGCGTSQEHEAEPEPGPGEATTLEHVHGLGVDPEDGTLYAASHFGVFRISEDGTATQVAGRWQDTMAFTVTGPNTFLGSGHPDLRDDLPPHLGLIESTDGAETWTSVSLEGEADFHALEVAGPNTFGFDALSGRLMVTRDRETWSEVATAQIIDLAWPGQNSDVVVATTARGLVEYGVGRRARDLESAPPLVLIDSPRPGELVGVTATGEVYSATSSSDGNWLRADKSVPGAPEAFEAIPNAWYAASDRGIYRSADRGQSWDQIYGHDGTHH